MREYERGLVGLPVHGCFCRQWRTRDKEWQGNAAGFWGSQRLSMYRLANTQTLQRSETPPQQRHISLLYHAKRYKGNQ